MISKNSCTRFANKNVPLEFQKSNPAPFLKTNWKKYRKFYCNHHGLCQAQIFSSETFSRSVSGILSQQNIAVARNQNHPVCTLVNKRTTRLFVRRTPDSRVVNPKSPASYVLARIKFDCFGPNAAAAAAVGLEARVARCSSRRRSAAARRWAVCIKSNYDVRY